MTTFETLENTGIGLSGTGDIMIEENKFEALVMKALEVDDPWTAYTEVEGYGEVSLDSSTFYCDYASNNSFKNLGCWINDDNFVFYISEFDFNGWLKKNNKKLHDVINEEVEKMV